jgi:hypothetical protein
MHLGRPLLIIFLKVWTHTNKKFLHGLMAAFLFCGGNMVAAMPLFVRAFFLAGSPRTPVRLLGRALTHE